MQRFKVKRQGDKIISVSLDGRNLVPDYDDNHFGVTPEMVRGITIAEIPDDLALRIAMKIENGKIYSYQLGYCVHKLTSDAVELDCRFQIPEKGCRSILGVSSYVNTIREIILKLTPAYDISDVTDCTDRGDRVYFDFVRAFKATSLDEVIALSDALFQCILKTGIDLMDKIKVFLNDELKQTLNNPRRPIRIEIEGSNNFTIADLNSKQGEVE